MQSIPLLFNGILQMHPQSPNAKHYLQASSICFSLGELEPVTSYNSERFAIPSTHLVLHMAAGFGSGALARKNYEVPLEDNDPGAKEPVRNSIAKKCERVRINNALKPHVYPRMTHNMTIHHTSKHTEFQSWYKVNIPIMARHRNLFLWLLDSFRALCSTQTLWKYDGNSPIRKGWKHHG